MVRVVSPDQPFRIDIPGLDHLPPVKLADYWIDRHEVTNREFKRFVDDGGYRRAELWREPFVKDGKPIAARRGDGDVRRLHRTAGPAQWERGPIRPGLADHPVSGVSWYKAAAFARWAGKSLPTIYHWSRAADQRLSGDVVPASNFGGKGVLAGGTAGGANRAGASGMAGNVKEWVWNAAGARRYILGGAWNEPVYMFTDVDAQAPFSARCRRTDSGASRSIARKTSRRISSPTSRSPSRDLRRIVPAVTMPCFARGRASTRSTTATSTRRWTRPTTRRSNGAWKR